jgi:coenzyme F420-reducing hydrogenase alpha subunit
MAEEELKKLKQMILDAVPMVNDVAEVLLSLAGNFPAFERQTEYVALVDEVEFGLYDGKIGCLMPDGKQEIVEVADYKTVTNEWVSPLSTAKYTKHNMESYMAGALARVNNNFDRLHPEAKKIADALGFKAPCYNTYLNSAAQFIEAVHSAYTAVGMIDELLEIGIKDEELVKPTKFGQGAGAVEVPRGILFHEYAYDNDGFCTMGNCIIPTNQNHANIQADFDKLVPEMIAADKTEEEMTLLLEMMVRAYDPCISCSTHYLDVTFKK